MKVMSSDFVPVFLETTSLLASAEVIVPVNTFVGAALLFVAAAGALLVYHYNQRMTGARTDPGRTAPYLGVLPRAFAAMGS